MTEHDSGSDSTPQPPPSDRLAAHERLATGSLARWYRACATHPGRVIGTWLVIIPTLIVSVAAFGGELRDEFSIPGSETQKRDRSDRVRVLLRAGRRPERRLRRARGRVARHAGAPGGDRGSGREAPDGRVRAHRRQGRDRERRRPVRGRHDLRRRAHRLLPGPVQRRDHGQGPRPGRRGRGRRARDPRAGRARGGVQRRGGVPAARAGPVGAHRHPRGAVRPALPLPDAGWRRRSRSRSRSRRCSRRS